MDSGYRELTTYDLVSRGSSSGGECRGGYNATAVTAWGSGYQYNCIHSGEIVTSGYLPTTWYNYPFATAGTIISENTSSSNPANNTTTATESICPKGWTLPSKAQADSNRNVTLFSPVLGGNYSNGVLNNETIHGLWWSSEASNGARRHGLFYSAGTKKLTTSDGYNYTGRYVRCVQSS